MSRAHCTDVVFTHNGLPVSIVPNAQITVYDAGTTDPYAGTLYDSESGSGTLSNPFYADEDGNFSFYIATDDWLKLVVTGEGIGTITRDHIPVIRDPGQLIRNPNPSITEGVFTDSILVRPTITDGIFEGDIYTNGLIIRPEKHGAIADFQHFAGATISSGSPNLTLTSAPGLPITVGMVIGIQGAGAAGGVLVSTILSVTDSTHYVLNNNASTSVSGQVVDVGTDNTTALNDTWAEAKDLGGTIECVGGSYGAKNLNFTDAHGITIKGVEATTFSTNSIGSINRGTFFLALPGTTGTFIDWSGNAAVALIDIQIGRSDQNDWCPGLELALLMAGKSGQETTKYLMSNVYISGSYSISTAYFSVNNTIRMFGCFLYNYYNTGSSRVLSLTANNWANVESGFIDVNNVAAYGATGNIQIIGGQLNDLGHSGGVSSNHSSNYSLHIDGVFDIYIESTQILGANRGIILQDESLSADEISRLITLRHVIFEESISGGATLLSAIFVNSNTLIESLIMENCRIKVETAWIEDGGSAGSSTGIANSRIEGCKSINGTENAIQINQVASTNNRIIASILHLDGLDIDITGRISPSTHIFDYGTITSSGQDNSVKWPESRPIFSAGMMVSANGFQDLNSNELINFTSNPSAVNQLNIHNATTGNSPIISALGDDTNINLELRGQGTGSIVVPAASGTPNANQLYRQSLTKAFARITCSAGVATAVATYNVNSTVTINGDGDYTITLLRPLSGSDYVFQVTAVSDNRYYACITNSTTGAGTIRIQIIDKDGNIVLPSEVHFTAQGLQ